MDFQTGDWCFPCLSPNVDQLQDPLELRDTIPSEVEDVFWYTSELVPFDTDWTIFDPLSTTSYHHLPQTSEAPLELPQSIWIAPTFPDQPTVSLPRF